ncbi:DUF2249 domain-containing protein [Aminipila butyrica]|uniref:DUF2249 domain-containing protein n=1 Tax=Aminipila butyrica TaxID=433296 RepID=A0A858BUP7_9FIRM|nr:DUF2249 domain-containing protein [Aminipila butyrica]QIB69307.1 DUF2249 domain-containing protein [Aminipila butyrica]
MKYEDWKDKTAEFKKIDVRHLQGNFFLGLRKQAQNLEIGEGLEVIQTFEPHPLYAVLEPLGFVHHTEKTAVGEFHVYFYRAEIKEAGGQAPYAPLALLNYPMIDEELGEIAVNFWDLTWNNDKRTLSYEMRLLLSLANAVGAGRMRQASRELVKAYASGIDSAALDDVFELIAWNQGIGYFSSEIGPSALFQAYKLIKTQEKNGKSREEIKQLLMERFGEKNEEVGVS